jgi:hypothetical protein
MAVSFLPSSTDLDFFQTAKRLPNGGLHVQWKQALHQPGPPPTRRPSLVRQGIFSSRYDSERGDLSQFCCTSSENLRHDYYLGSYIDITETRGGCMDIRTRLVQRLNVGSPISIEFNSISKALADCLLDSLSPILNTLPFVSWACFHCQQSIGVVTLQHDIMAQSQLQHGCIRKKYCNYVAQIDANK